MAKNRVIIKIVTLIAILTYLLLIGPLVVLGNTTEEKVTNNVTNSDINTVTNSVTNSVEINKDKEPITISVRNGSLRETVLGICRSYGISVIGVESLKGNITATVKGESPEEVIKELGRIYHFSVS
ncbi:MAG: secretion protein, partial [Veillonella sp.]|nr:secretion protein [Veillonella sp.]